jgi:hypothetical protein
MDAIELLRKVAARFIMEADFEDDHYRAGELREEADGLLAAADEIERLRANQRSGRP